MITEAASSVENYNYHFGSVPSELKDKLKWVHWKFIDRGNGPNKVPVDEYGNNLAWGNSANLKTYQEVIISSVLRGHGFFTGIGIVLPEDDDFDEDTPRIVIIDWDKCIDDNENVNLEVEQYIKKLETYSERSPSKRGIHTIGLARIKHGVPTFSFKFGQVMVRKHFVTITGDHISGTPNQLNDITEFIQELIQENGVNTKTIDPAIYDQVELVKKDDPRYKDLRIYCLKALQYEADIMVKTPEGHRNRQLNTSALKMGHYVGSGILTRNEVARKLIPAASVAGLSEGEIYRTIESGISAGIEQPKIPILNNPKSLFNSPNEETQCTTVVKYPSTIKSRADDIMRNCNPVEFLLKQAQRNHVGDEDIIKTLLASIASSNSLTSAGIQPAIHGEKGQGKTDAAKSVFHLIPVEWKIATSLSSKAPYYLKWRDGLIVFSDDVEWSPELIHTLKKAMGDFQQSQTHTTLDKNREPKEQKMAARVVWWISSVDNVASDQLIDRQYQLDIDDSPEHIDKVSDFIKNSRAKKEPLFSEDEDVQVARCIIDMIKNHEPFRVVIPFAARANWMLKKDHRSQKKFWDLVEGFAILRYKQRHTDEDGWLYANRADFDDAKELFMNRNMNHQTKLTKAQSEVVRAIIDGKDTQSEIAKKLGKSQQSVSKHLKTIMDNTNYIISTNGPYGEISYQATISSLEVVYKEEFVSLPEDYREPDFPQLTKLVSKSSGEVAMC